MKYRLMNSAGDFYRDSDGAFVPNWFSGDYYQTLEIAQAALAELMRRKIFDVTILAFEYVETN